MRPPSSAVNSGTFCPVYPKARSSFTRWIAWFHSVWTGHNLCAPGWVPVRQTQSRAMVSPWDSWSVFDFLMTSATVQPAVLCLMATSSRSRLITSDTLSRYQIPTISRLNCGCPACGIGTGCFPTGGPRPLNAICTASLLAKLRGPSTSWCVLCLLIAADRYSSADLYPCALRNAATLCAISGVSRVGSSAGTNNSSRRSRSTAASQVRILVRHDRRVDAATPMPKASR